MAKIKQIEKNVWNKYSVAIEMYGKEGNFIDCWDSTEVVAQDALSAINRTVREAAEDYTTFTAYALVKVERIDEHIQVAE